jgi:hypothetical protein
MRRGHPTVSSGEVHRLARRALYSALPWKPLGRSVQVGDLLDLLLLMAATARTLFAVARRRFPFSHESARQAVRANLPDIDLLAARLADALHDVLALSRRDRRRLWTVAIDTHDVPYYGDRGTPHAVGGQRKQGTQCFFRYATAVLLHRRRRYTVGLLAVTKATRPHQVVSGLLGQVESRGLTVGGVVLDSGFDSGDVLLELQRRGLSYTVPLRRKGRGPNRRNACFDWPSGTVGEIGWRTDVARQAVTTRVLVWRHAGQPRMRVYAFAGWGDAQAVAEARRAWLGRRRYRERFGVETSYRQKNQARAWTTSRSAAYRLLLEGLAHLLRQVWVRLTEELAQACSARPTAWLPLTLSDVIDLLAERLRSDHSPQQPIPPHLNPLEHRAAD